MKKKKILKILVGVIIFYLLFSVLTRLAKAPLSFKKFQPVYTEDYREIKDLNSQYAILIDRKSSQVVFGKNPQELFHPASMTKVMTALVVLENTKDLNKSLLISQDIIDYCLEKGLSVSGFQAGDQASIKDLLYGLLLESGGEAALALERSVAGGEEEFIRLMNKKARDLSMTSSNFSNSTGITDPENYSNAEDMAKLFNYALKNRQFRKIISQADHKVSGLFNQHSISNQLFLKRDALNIREDYISCGKTGYTGSAGLCLVSLGRLDSREYIAVTAGAEGNPHTEQFNLLDTEKLYESLVNKAN